MILALPEIAVPAPLHPRGGEAAPPILVLSTQTPGGQPQGQPQGQPGEQDTGIRYQGGGQGQGTSPPAEAEPTPGTQQPSPAPGGAPASPYEGCASQLVFFVPLLLLLYFLMIRPQQKQEKARRELLGKIQRGDRVVTNSGVHGVIASIADDTVQLLIDSEGKVKVTIDRAAIGRVLGHDSGPKNNHAGSRDKAAG
jgi:preprotein translocase subunit YajC